jgi:hypothetical protein
VHLFLGYDDVSNLKSHAALWVQATTQETVQEISETQSIARLYVDVALFFGTSNLPISRFKKGYSLRPGV